jgi:hypothetical protein
MPKALGRILCLLNIKDVTPTTSTGSISWKMPENYGVQEKCLTKSVIILKTD